MIKYAQSDISDGLNLLRIGINNIISSLSKGEENLFELPYKFPILILYGILYEIFDNNVECLDNTIIIKLDNTIIYISFFKNKTIFKNK